MERLTGFSITGTDPETNSSREIPYVYSERERSWFFRYGKRTIAYRVKHHGHLRQGYLNIPWDHSPMDSRQQSGILTVHELTAQYPEKKYMKY